MEQFSQGLSEVFFGRPTTLPAVGRNEDWLQRRLADDLQHLGLGPLKLETREQGQAGGGSLDLLASQGDTLYSIEVQLGEVDSDHGFRVLDYWARNKRSEPERTHVAVLVAESVRGRYRIALEELARHLPLLVVEMRAFIGQQEVVLVPELVIQNDAVDLGDAPLAQTVAERRTREDWEGHATDEAWQFHLKFVEWARSNLDPNIRVDYGPKSYIGVRVGARVWAPLWLRRDGAYVYLPDPDLSRDNESAAFEHFQRRLEDETQLSLQWASNYNAGANPIGIRLTSSALAIQAVQDLLRASFDALQGGAIPWTRRREEIDDLAVDGIQASVMSE